MTIFADISTPLLIGLLAGMAATGILGGLLAGLLGVGGGIVIVPVLYNILPFFGVDDAIRIHVAIGTSLATIIPTSISSARSHYKKGAIDMALLKSWGPVIFIGVIIGTVTASFSNAGVLTLVFAVLALLVAANMAFRPENAHLADGLPKSPIKELIALFIGGFSAMMGIGGGTFTVPVLTIFNYPIRKAVGTAAAIGLIIAVPGTIGFLISGLDADNLPPGNIGYVNILGFLMIFPLAALCAPLGAKIAHQINANLLKKAFAFFLFVTSLRMFYSLYG
ncbi:TSUP family transporter [Sneathiella chungangensis]|uniref:Probable membrane transporter protein n=1 Tax=Sneathiella chungangensis TaxID=1418234 RepID=A0A845MFN8_9PROT|nr:sulfite exporter TauE/SafE family protein [Sneathiella chungangensis]MZR22462.1 TSUP family transporter [Sneathiella chungangensis]